MKKNKFIILLLIIVLHFAAYSYGSYNSKFISHLESIDFYSISLKSIDELSEKLNITLPKESVVYFVSKKDKIYGITYDNIYKCYNFFVEDIKNEKLYIFLTNPMADFQKERDIEFLINNLYAFYYTDYKKRIVGYCVLNDSFNHFNYYQIKNNKINKFNSYLKENINIPSEKRIEFFINIEFKLKFYKGKKQEPILKKNINKIKPSFLTFLLKMFN